MLEGRRQRRTSRDRLSWLAALVVAGALVLVVPALLPVSVRSLLGLGPTALGTPPGVAAGGSYAFLQHQRGRPDEPVAWDPCRPVRYVVNPAGGPPEAERLVDEAVSEASRATGLVFEYDGATDRRPDWHEPTLPTSEADRPVLISWASADEVPELAGDVAGIGGAVATPGPHGGLRYTTGGVTLDVESFQRLAAMPGGWAQQRAIVMHELGHLLGLAHVEDPEELMFDDNLGRVDFGTGDLNGLARLGAGDCF